MLDGRGRNVTKLGILISFALGLGLSLTTYGYLAVVAGIFGGLFFNRVWRGAFYSFVGVALAWLVSISGRPSGPLVIQMGDWLHLGDEFSGSSKILVILIGGAMGAVGGAIGSGIQQIRKGKTSTVYRKGNE